MTREGLEQTRTAVPGLLVVVIGHGDPPPTNKFRWCTDRLRIAPVRRALDAIGGGDCPVLLGVRLGESKERDRTLARHRRDRYFFRQQGHESATIFSPMIDYTLQDVWATLARIASPASVLASRFSALYRDVSGECPIVRDPRGTPCGTGRFGCWTCTVVRQDRAVTSMVAEGCVRWTPSRGSDRDEVAMLRVGIEVDLDVPATRNDAEPTAAGVIQPGRHQAAGDAPAPLGRRDVGAEEFEHALTCGCVREQRGAARKTDGEAVGALVVLDRLHRLAPPAEESGMYPRPRSAAATHPGYCSTMQTISSESDIDAALAAPLAVLYKHSPICPTSGMAYDEIRELRRMLQDVPIYVVDVIRSRPLSRYIADRIGITHQSPQVIILQAGVPRWHGSHFDIGAAALAARLELLRSSA